MIFTGFIAHSSNLALKGILAIGAMAQIATRTANTADAQRYAGISKSYIAQWVTKSQDSSGKHLKLAYDMDGSWSLKYNAFMDRLLGTKPHPCIGAARRGSVVSNAGCCVRHSFGQSPRVHQVGLGNVDSGFPQTTRPCGNKLSIKNIITSIKPRPVRPSAIGTIPAAAPRTDS